MIIERWENTHCLFCDNVCGTLKCENDSICEKVAKCEKISTLSVKIDAICKKLTLYVNKLGYLNVYKF